MYKYIKSSRNSPRQIHCPADSPEDIISVSQFEQVSLCAHIPAYEIRLESKAETRFCTDQRFRGSHTSGGRHTNQVRVLCRYQVTAVSRSLKRQANSKRGKLTYRRYIYSPDDHVRHATRPLLLLLLSPPSTSPICSSLLRDLYHHGDFLESPYRILCLARAVW